MIPEIMSQEELDPSANPSPENQSSAPQIIPNTPLPDPASWEHVVIALSPQKQEQLMKGIEHVESEEPRLSTWPIIARAISTALLSTPSGLYVQSSMQLHRKDFLLFTRTDSKRRDGTGGILEMHISNNHQGATWQGHWQQARPTIAHFLKETFNHSPKAGEKVEEKAEDKAVEMAEEKAVEMAEEKVVEMAEVKVVERAEEEAEEKEEKKVEEKEEEKENRTDAEKATASASNA